MHRRAFLLGAMGGVCRYALPAVQGSLGTVAYIQEDGLYLRELRDGSPRRLVTGTKMDSPRFSPSGKWIAYFRDDVLHVVSREGRSRELGKPDRGSAVPGEQWCVGRDHLLVGRANGVDVFAADSGWNRPVRRIADASLPVVFSPTGNDIVYGDAIAVGRGPGGEPMRTGRLCRISLERADSVPKVLGSEYLAEQIPCVWTGNGEAVIFWRDPDFSASAVADGLELFRASVTGGAPRSLGISTFVRNDMFSFLPGQNKLAVSTGGGREEWEEKRIAVIDPGTGAVSHVTGVEMTAVCPAWSPGGRAIAYSAAPGPAAGLEVGGGEEARRLLSARRIWVAEVQSPGAGKRLTNDARYRDEEPMWSSDGEYILFCRMAADNSKSLWLMRGDGSGAVQVAGPLYIAPGLLGVDDSWFGYYGYIEWSSMFDWFRAPA